MAEMVAKQSPPLLDSSNLWLSLQAKQNRTRTELIRKLNTYSKCSDTAFFHQNKFLWTTFQVQIICSS
jgi:hypothetical protein